MKRYIALLRGINISGKNKIPMSELKDGFAELRFTEITTYLNSGNVIFSCDITDQDILFIIPPLSYEQLYEELGEPKSECEKVHNDRNVVFWSFSRKDYQKTNWWSKTARTNASDKITIRTANTVRKIVHL